MARNWSELWLYFMHSINVCESTLCTNYIYFDEPHVKSGSFLQSENLISEKKKLQCKIKKLMYTLLVSYK